jgi:hypothetical protein
MKLSDIKSGNTVMLSDGLQYTILDNNIGVTRLVVSANNNTVYRIQSYEIEMVNIDGVWHYIALSDKQEMLKQQVESL